MTKSLYSPNVKGSWCHFMTIIITEISVDVLNIVIKFCLIVSRFEAKQFLRAEPFYAIQALFSLKDPKKNFVLFTCGKKL